MSLKKRIFLLAGLILILGTEFALFLRFTAPGGVRLADPEPGEKTGLSFTAAGNAWMQGGTDRVVVHARSAEGAISIFPASGIRVETGVTAPVNLTAFKAEIRLPRAGAWDLFAEAVGKDGRSLRTQVRTISASTANTDGSFAFGSLAHVVPVLLTLMAMGAILILWRRPAGERLRERLRWGLAIVIWTNEIVYQIYWFASGAWSPAASLSVHMCGLTNLLLPFLLFRSRGKLKPRLFEFLFFWGTCGAMIALLFPDMGGRGFPSLKYFTFFISHGGILVCLAAMTAEHGRDLSFRSLLRASGLSLGVMAATWAANLGLQFLPPFEPGNYMLLAYPPPGDPVLGFFAQIFGPAPRHALGVVGVILAGSIIIFGVFILARVLHRRLRPGRSPGPD
jgi:hypothetical integral membrane protein (TIGR02206 family)